MPYKANEARRHRIPRARYRVTNWTPPKTPPAWPLPDDKPLNSLAPELPSGRFLDPTFAPASEKRFFLNALQARGRFRHHTSRGGAAVSGEAPVRRKEVRAAFPGTPAAEAGRGRGRRGGWSGPARCAAAYDAGLRAGSVAPSGPEKPSIPAALRADFSTTNRFRAPFVEHHQ